MPACSIRARSRRLWPTLLWLAACLFLGDVAVRRIAIDFGAIMTALAKEWQKITGREVATSSDYMDKLRSRKAEVDEQLDRSKSAPRPEPAPPLVVPAQAPSGPIGEPLLDGGEAGAVPAAAGRAGPAPRHGRRTGRPRERKLHQPPLEGQTTCLGRTRERKRSGISTKGPPV